MSDYVTAEVLVKVTVQVPAGTTVSRALDGEGTGLVLPDGRNIGPLVGFEDLESGETLIGDAEMKSKWGISIVEYHDVPPVAGVHAVELEGKA